MASDKDSAHLADGIHDFHREMLSRHLSAHGVLRAFHRQRRFDLTFFNQNLMDVTSTGSIVVGTKSAVSQNWEVR